MPFYPSFAPSRVVFYRHMTAYDAAFGRVWTHAFTLDRRSCLAPDHRPCPYRYIAKNEGDQGPGNCLMVPPTGPEPPLYLSYGLDPCHRTTKEFTHEGTSSAWIVLSPWSIVMTSRGSWSSTLSSSVTSSARAIASFMCRILRT